MARRIGIVLTFTLVLASFSAIDASAEDRNCAALLVQNPASSASDPEPATEVDLGCYPTFAGAVAAGSGGGIELPADASAAALTQAELESATTDALTSVMIGTEFTNTAFGGVSKSYFADVTCSASQTWEVSYVTDAWNDDFESGKGFGGCDHNKKFHDSNFGGASITCTPNCSDYGTLANEVSSLRWKV